MSVIIDGKAAAAQLRQKLTREIADMSASGITPGLAAIQVGEDNASSAYFNSKAKLCAEMGIYSEQHLLPDTTPESDLLVLLDRLAVDPKIHGILLYLPLPKHFVTETVICHIPPEKDVDGLHPLNISAFFTGNFRFIPCTPAGAIALLEREEIAIEGKECVVVGRSNIVGKPMAMLLLGLGGTVTICHSKTQNLAEICRRADILVSAVGKPRFITGDMVKPGAAVIDVGINRDADGKLCGDADFESVSSVAGFTTPVPGGVGAMTSMMLIKNTLVAAKLQKNLGFS